MQNNISVSNFKDLQISAFGTCNNRLNATNCLRPGNRLCSSNGLFRLAFGLKKGDLAVFENTNITIATPIWQTETENMNSVKACLHSNGLFEIRNRKRVVWSSRSGSIIKDSKFTYALMEDDGNFTIYVRNVKRWSSGEDMQFN